MAFSKSSNRFSILPIKHIYEDEDADEEASTTQPKTPVFSLPKRAPRTTQSPHSPPKHSLAKLPPFLRIPRELRWMIFDALVAAICEIEISPSFIDTFHALRLSTKGLREEVIGWHTKRRDVINAFPFGCFLPQQTTFVLKIDHRWKKCVKHKTVSGSHVTFKSGAKQRKQNDGLLLETKAIKYMTREQSWYSFCRAVSTHHMSLMHLKFEIFLPEEFAPTSHDNGLSQIPRAELFEALAASRYQEGAWASQHVYVLGTLDQLASMYQTDTLAQIGDLVHVVQKSAFDAETWTLFREHQWEVDDYDSLTYPFDATYWEDAKCKREGKGRGGRNENEEQRSSGAVLVSSEDWKNPILVRGWIEYLLYTTAVRSGIIR
ncbi:hypothetical protein EAE96_005299 [Botrytis aclada]|nr:hypothetical protein EAE96_005299 [Botrytis aclada]